MAATAPIPNFDGLATITILAVASALRFKVFGLGFNSALYDGQLSLVF